ncbi:MAG: DegT/DnrJ/EryC1/StrS family aminotransferase [Nitrospinae bacterium]|nr:DegT/DnrJ/EryC1/StrS family aminotransferase [Nitrospinota bacterium]
MIFHSKPTLNKEDSSAVSRVINSGYISQGEAVARFESELAEYIGVKGGGAVSSGTSALHLSLIALGVKEGDDVAMPTYVCPALLNPINYIGANPLLIDINPDSYNISPADLKKKLTKKTRAVIVPHIFGLPADIKDILSIGIPVIEDCAQSVGAVYNGKKAGSFGHCAIFSFYATKVMTTGEGGMVVSNSDKILEKIKDLREYDHKPNYMVRYNYKMTDLQAAIGISQLKRLDSFISRRRNIALAYSKRFSELEIAIPKVYTEREHIYFRYVIKNRVKGQGSRVKGLEEDLKFFEVNGVKCMRPIFKPIHRYLKLKGFPEADRAWNELISIPIYPSLTDGDVKKIVRVTEKWQEAKVE